MTTEIVQLESGPAAKGKELVRPKFAVTLQTANTWLNNPVGPMTTTPINLM
jgi:hypothetical protein